MATVLQIRPRRLIHGHPPLTAFFTMEAMPGLFDAMTALHARTVSAAYAARPTATSGPTANLGGPVAGVRAYF